MHFLYINNGEKISLSLVKGESMNLFTKPKKTVIDSDELRNNTILKTSSTTDFSNVQSLQPILDYSIADFQNGKFKYQLYQFLSDTVPAVHACLETWVRLSAAPGEFVTKSEQGKEILKQLSDKLYFNSLGQSGSLVSFVSELFRAFYRDGLYSGFVLLEKNGKSIDRFLPISVADIQIDEKNRFYLEFNEHKIFLDRNDFYAIPFNADRKNRLGKSILQTVPFVSYIEQQLVDDMRRTSHNSGFHRLHVQITPPERMGGEGDSAYIDRINSYFDSTVSMIKSCDIDENPVTWDNVTINHVGPENVKSVTNSWFMNHRAMIEEICAGTNLAPFLLGYSFGATTTWASFKFDIVMRSIKSVQAEVSAFLEWLGNIELALHGINEKCSYQFDNSFAYQATENSSVRSQEVDSIIKLYNAGLLEKEMASVQVERLLK